MKGEDGQVECSEGGELWERQVQEPHLLGKAGMWGQEFPYGLSGGTEPP